MANNREKVVAFDMYGNVKSYPRQFDCAHDLGIATQDVSAFMRGRRKTVPGHVLFHGDTPDISKAILRRCAISNCEEIEPTRACFLAYHQGFLDALNELNKRGEMKLRYEISEELMSELKQKEMNYD